MKSRVPTALTLVILSTLLLFSAPKAHADERSTSLREQPLMFVENVGQFAPGAMYQVQGLGVAAYLAGDGVWFKLAELPSRTTGSKHEALASLSERTGHETSLRLEFVGANSAARLVPMNRLETKVSYLKGGDPADWHADVPVWGGVRYVDLYPGMDLEITGGDGHWAWRLVVRDPSPAWGSQEAELVALSRVSLQVEGGTGIAIRNGMMLIGTKLGDLALPLIEVTGSESVPSPAMAGRQRVAAPFAVSSKPTLSEAQLAVDSDLVFSTFLGGGDKDEAFAIALDDEGSMYIAGYTWSSNFPVSALPYDDELDGDYDAFILKMPGDGSTLTYATYLGGSLNDSITAVAVDGDGNAYLTGVTFSTDYPTSPSCFDEDLGSSDPEEGDAFATKLNATGTGLIYSTYLGGDADDRGWDIALKDGYAYVVGETWPEYSDPFPTTPGAYDRTHSGGTEVFVSKLKLDGSGLEYSTLVGLAGDEEAYSVAVDASGNVYIVGETSSTGFATVGAFDEIHKGDEFAMDAFVAKLNSSGSARIYATYLGGSDDEWAEAMTIDSDGCAYVTGYTYSTDFPTTTLAYDGSHNGEFDIFVTKVNATGSDLVYSTFYGGSADEDAFGIAIDSEKRVHIVGYTFSSDFPVTPGAYDTSLGGSRDAFVVKFEDDASDVIYSTFLGGTDNVAHSAGDWANGVVLDSSDDVYLTGLAWSSDFATKNAYDSSHNGDADAFVAKMTLPDAKAYYVTMLTNGGSVSPDSGWYNRGAELAIGVTAPQAGSGEQFAWQGWTGEGEGSYTGANQSASIAVLDLITQTATWQHEYWLELDTNAGVVTPDSGWQEAGDNVQIEATAPGAGSGEQYLWGGWTGQGSGSYSGMANQVTIGMSGPITETATWTQQFSLTMRTNMGSVSPLSGWQDAGTQVEIEATSPPLGSGEQYLWNGWTGEGSGAYTGMSNPKVVDVTAPITETASWSHQFMLTMQTNAGTVTPVTGWQDADGQVQIEATPPYTGTGEQYLWDGWTGDGVNSYTGSSNPKTLDVTAPMTETASWSHQFMFTVETSPPGLATIPGGGWKAADSVAATGTAEPTISVGETEYTFVEWRVDGSPVFGNPINVTMDGAHTATAYYSAGANEPPSTVSVSPSSGWGIPGVVLFFTAEYTDPDGADNIRFADILVNGSANSTKCIAARYNVQDNTMQINDPATNNVFRAGAKTPGVAGLLKHIYGILDVGQSSVSKDGNTLRITWALQFTWRMSGQLPHSPYLRVEDMQGEAEGWNDHGSFVVNRTPNYLIPPTELSPRNGVANVNELQWFDPAYRDLDREWTLDELYFLIADSLPADGAPDSAVPPGVYLKYEHKGGVEYGRLFIWDSRTTRWLGPYEPYGTTGPADGPNAILITRWSKPIYADFRTIKVLWRLQFKPTFLGTHQLYMRAVDIMGKNNGGDTGWKWKGTVTIQ